MVARPLRDVHSSLVRNVQDLVVEYGEVERKTETIIAAGYVTATSVQIIQPVIRLYVRPYMHSRVSCDEAS